MADHLHEDQGLRNLAYNQAERINQLLSRDTLDLDGLGRAVNALKATLNFKITKPSKDTKKPNTFPSKWDSLAQAIGKAPKDVDPEAWDTKLRIEQFEALMDAAIYHGVFDTMPVPKNAFSLNGGNRDD